MKAISRLIQDRIIFDSNMGHPGIAIYYFRDVELIKEADMYSLEWIEDVIDNQLRDVEFDKRAKSDLTADEFKETIEKFLETYPACTVYEQWYAADMTIVRITKLTGESNYMVDMLSEIFAEWGYELVSENKYEKIFLNDKIVSE